MTLFPSSSDFPDLSLTASPSNAPDQASGLQITGIMPLDDQLGVAAPLSVPLPLRDALFGGLADLPESGDWSTFAILDAARQPGLVEMLESSGLAHACLFQGKAEDDLRDVAPWIVELQEDNRFTRALFTAGDAPWQMWDRDLGIFLRVPCDLAAARKHFRRFTKVRDGQGQWFFFRFWESRFAHRLLQDCAAETRAALLAIGPLLIRNPAGDGITVFQAAAGQQCRKTPFQLQEQDLAALRIASSARYLEKLEGWLTQSYGATPSTLGATGAAAVEGLARRAWRMGLSSERSIAEYAAVSWIAGQPAEEAYDFNDVPAGRLPARLVRLHKDLSEKRKAKRIETS